MTDEERQRQRRNMKARAKRNARAGRHPRETLIMVSNGPLRERYLWMVATNQTSAAQVAANLDWYAGRSPDSRRVRRALGLLEQTSSRRDEDGEPIRAYLTEIGYELAANLCRGMNACPADVGV